MHLQKQKQTNSIRKLIGATTDNGSRQLAFLPLLLATAKPGSNDISSKNSHCANDPKTMETELRIPTASFAFSWRCRVSREPLRGNQHQNLFRLLSIALSYWMFSLLTVLLIVFLCPSPRVHWTCVISSLQPASGITICVG